MKRHIIFFVLTLVYFTAFSQGNCEFKIDTAKILANKNLDGFVSNLLVDSFIITNNKKSIPSFIKKQLDCFTGKFSIANPGEPFQYGCVIIEKLPRRQIHFLAKSKNVLVLTYTHGGSAMTKHLLFIKFEGKQITDFWAGVSLDVLDTKEKIIDYIEKSKHSPAGLNTNCIYL